MINNSSLPTVITHHATSIQSPLSLGGRRQGVPTQRPPNLNPSLSPQHIQGGYNATSQSTPSSMMAPNDLSPPYPRHYHRGQMNHYGEIDDGLRRRHMEGQYRYQMSPTSLQNTSSFSTYSSSASRTQSPSCGHASGTRFSLAPQSPPRNSSLPTRRFLLSPRTASFKKRIQENSQNFPDSTASLQSFGWGQKDKEKEDEKLVESAVRTEITRRRLQKRARREIKEKLQEKVNDYVEKRVVKAVRRLQIEMDQLREAEEERVTRHMQKIRSFQEEQIRKEQGEARRRHQEAMKQQEELQRVEREASKAKLKYLEEERQRLIQQAAEQDREAEKITQLRAKLEAAAHQMQQEEIERRELERKRRDDVRQQREEMRIQKEQERVAAKERLERSRAKRLEEEAKFRQLQLEKERILQKEIEEVKNMKMKMLEEMEAEKQRIYEELKKQQQLELKVSKAQHHRYQSTAGGYPLVQQLYQQSSRMIQQDPERELSPEEKAFMLRKKAVETIQAWFKGWRDRKLYGPQLKTKMDALRIFQRKMRKAVAPLFMAIQSGDKRKVKQRLFFAFKDQQHRVKMMNTTDRTGLSPLTFAVQHDKLAIVKILLANGANANKQDGRGNTPLHYACKQCHKPMVTVLIRFGAIPGFKNKQGRECYEMAPPVRREEMRKYVQECVDHHNNPPRLNRPISNQRVSVGVKFEMIIPSDTFVDDDGDELEYSANGMPPSIRFIAKKRKFIGAPTLLDLVPDVKKETGQMFDTKMQNKKYIIEVTANDDYSSASTTFVLTVFGSSDNRPPEVKQKLYDQECDVGVPFRLQCPPGLFYDPDGDELEITAEGAPPSIVFDSSTQTFEGTPLPAEAIPVDVDEEDDVDLLNFSGIKHFRVYEITVTANDGEYSATTSFELSVQQRETPL